MDELEKFKDILNKNRIISSSLDDKLSQRLKEWAIEIAGKILLLNVYDLATKVHNLTKLILLSESISRMIALYRYNTQYWIMIGQIQLSSDIFNCSPIRVPKEGIPSVYELKQLPPEQALDLVLSRLVMREDLK
jgi:hypothetical protein